MEADKHGQRWTLWFLWRERWPDLAPSDLFGLMKEVMRRKKFTTNDELHAAVHQWRRDTPKEWYATQIRKLPERWNKCTDIGGEYL
ncbi:hypothetical protein C0J52_12584 [Blattella germanica]|nr:hypothetical protein C0J52_12584 [Blattella germanica]